MDKAYKNKVTLQALVGVAFYEGVQKADAWLEKWDGHYTVMRDESGDDDFAYDMDIMCTDEAYHAMPDDIQCITSWSENKEQEL